MLSTTQDEAKHRVVGHLESKRATKPFPQLRYMQTDFHNCFGARLITIFILNSSLKISLYFKRKATISGEILKQLAPFD